MRLFGLCGDNDDDDVTTTRGYVIYFLRAGKVRTLEDQPLLQAASALNFFGKTFF